jgi:polar amino acid transport system substrate-binding protein
VAGIDENWGEPMAKLGWGSLIALLLGVMLLAAPVQAAGKCEHLIATGDPERPPYLWRDPQNQERLIGATADLLGAIAQELGVTIDVIYAGDWSRTLESARAGRVDLLLGTALTLTLLDSMDFVHPAFLSPSYVVWMRKGREFPYSSWADLQGREGYTLINNSFGQEFDAYARLNLRLNLVPSLAQAFQGLLLGRSEYVLAERYAGLISAESLEGSGDLLPLEPLISGADLYLTVSHNSACNDPWLRGQLAKKMTEFVAAGLPQTLLQRNFQRWKAQQQAEGPQNQ